MCLYGKCHHVLPVRQGVAREGQSETIIVETTCPIPETTFRTVVVMISAGDPDPSSAGTAGDAGRWDGSIAAVGTTANLALPAISGEPLQFNIGGEKVRQDHWPSKRHLSFRTGRKGESSRLHDLTNSRAAFTPARNETLIMNASHNTSEPGIPEQHPR